MILANLHNKAISLFAKTGIPHIPWITYTSKKYIDNYLKKNMTVFEWGSGGSTLYFSDRVKKVISIEHDPVWYEKVKRELLEAKTANCDYQLVRPVKEKEETKKDGLDFKSTDTKFKNYSFKSYCQYIDEFPANYFDLILIDGRARIGCAKHACNKVKRKGVIVLDNSEREEYTPAINSLLKNGFEEIKFFGEGPIIDYEWQTSVFLKK